MPAILKSHILQCKFLNFYLFCEYHKICTVNCKQMPSSCEIAIRAMAVVSHSLPSHQCYLNDSYQCYLKETAIKCYMNDTAIDLTSTTQPSMLPERQLSMLPE